MNETPLEVAQRIIDEADTAADILYGVQRHLDKIDDANNVSDEQRQTDVNRGLAVLSKLEIMLASCADPRERAVFYGAVLGLLSRMDCEPPHFRASMAMLEIAYYAVYERRHAH